MLKEYDIMPQVKEIAQAYLAESLALLESLPVHDQQAQTLMKELIIKQSDRVK